MDISRELLEELRDLRAWRERNDSDLDLLDYAGFVGTPDLLFAFAELFSPRLTVHEGEYFLASGFEAALYEEWMAKLGDAVAVQRMMNHLHVSTFLQNQLISDAMARAVAEEIARFWSRQFAELGLVAEVSGEDLRSATVTLVRAG